ncbi:hypothetical protein AMTRI_Chr05g68430 [Amborella trichopoda]
MLKKSFKPGKCKTSLKLAIARIKLMKNKKGVQLKQMKRELAQLLQAGQEQNARIRVEHVIREENTMAAYDIIELFCELIVARLPIIESQKHCPIDLKEAIASLAFASPRCADIPELLDVQKHFAAKYGKDFISSSLELRPGCGVNCTMIEKLSVRAPNGETKIKILTAIAKEHNIDWDPAAAEEQIIKTHEDLLVGSNKFVSSANVSVQPSDLEFPSPPTQKPVPASQLPQDEARKSPASSETFRSGETMSPHSTMRSDLPPTEPRPPDNRSEIRESRFSSFEEGNKTSLNRHGWNMEFKDAASAAHAAAESAERASIAARAAAELSIRPRTQHPMEPYAQTTSSTINLSNQWGQRENENIGNESVARSHSKSSSHGSSSSITEDDIHTQNIDVLYRKPFSGMKPGCSKPEVDEMNEYREGKSESGSQSSQPSFTNDYGHGKYPKEAEQSSFISSIPDDGYPKETQQSFSSFSNPDYGHRDYAEETQQPSSSFSKRDYGHENYTKDTEQPPSSFNDPDYGHESYSKDTQQPHDHFITHYGHGSYPQETQQPSPRFSTSDYGHKDYPKETQQPSSVDHSSVVFDDSSSESDAHIIPEGNDSYKFDYDKFDQGKLSPTLSLDSESRGLKDQKGAYSGSSPFHSLDSDIWGPKEQMAGYSGSSIHSQNSDPWGPKEQMAGYSSQRNTHLKMDSAGNENSPFEPSHITPKPEIKRPSRDRSPVVFDDSDAMSSESEEEVHMYKPGEEMEAKGPKETLEDKGSSKRESLESEGELKLGKVVGGLRNKPFVRPPYVKPPVNTDKPASIDSPKTFTSSEKAHNQDREHKNSQAGSFKRKTKLSAPRVPNYFDSESEDSESESFTRPVEVKSFTGGKTSHRTARSRDSQLKPSDQPGSKQESPYAGDSSLSSSSLRKNFSQPNPSVWVAQDVVGSSDNVRTRLSQVNLSAEQPLRLLPEREFAEKETMKPYSSSERKSSSVANRTSQLYPGEQPVKKPYTSSEKKSSTVANQTSQLYPGEQPVKPLPEKKYAEAREAPNPSNYSERKSSSARNRPSQLNEQPAMPVPEKKVTETKKSSKPSGSSEKVEPDRVSSHVHPKLPDYDKLAAQFESLRKDRRSS